MPPSSAANASPADEDSLPPDVDGSRAAPNATDTSSLPSAAELGFEVTGEEVLFSRWLQLSNRTIRFPAHDGRPAASHEFDTVGHPKTGFQFAVVFPFHPAAPGREAQVTLLREFSQGVGEMMFVLPTGAFDPRRHADALAAAQAELSEEVALYGQICIESQTFNTVMFMLPTSACDPRPPADTLARSCGAVATNG